MIKIDIPIKRLVQRRSVDWVKCKFSYCSSQSTPDFLGLNNLRKMGVLLYSDKNSHFILAPQKFRLAFGGGKQYMQIIFDAKTTPEEYHRLGKDFPFPKLHNCLNPGCKKPIPPKKHGFYPRTVRDGNFNENILIRRYWCPYCGMTFSFLPSFCLPHYQHTLKVIFLFLQRFFELEWTTGDCVKAFSIEYPALYLYRQNLEFYARRFFKNMNRIKLGLRQLKPHIQLPPGNNKKEAQKMLSIVTSGFLPIHTFSQRFFAQCGHSFMAS